MKTQHKRLIVLGVCVLIFLAFNRFRPLNPLGEVSPNPSSNIAPTTGVSRVNLGLTNKKAVTNAESLAGAGASPSGQQGKVIAVANDPLSEWLIPIEFYGRVVDENNGTIRFFRNVLGNFHWRFSRFGRAYSQGPSESVTRGDRRSRALWRESSSPPLAGPREYDGASRFSGWPGETTEDRLQGPRTDTADGP